jgi:nucleoside-diphosphate-sugar epimerase
LTARQTDSLLDVWGQREDSRDFLFSESAATRIIQLLNLRFEGLINVGSGVERKIYDIAEFIANHVGLKGINPKVGAVNAIHNRTLNISKLNQICGPLGDDFDSQISGTIDWLISHSTSARR